MTALTLKTVDMTDGSRKLKLVTAYNPELVKRLRNLNGDWNSTAKAWYFPTDLSGEIRKICIDIFGLDPDPLAEMPPDLVDVRFVLNDETFGQESSQTFWLFGREILSRLTRDSSVRPGEGVSILSGGFRPTGGSARYPAMGSPEEETVLLIRGVPRAMAETFRAGKTKGDVAVVEQNKSQPLALNEAKAAAAILAALLKKLSKEDQEAVIHQLVSALEEKPDAK